MGVAPKNSTPVKSTHNLHLKQAGINAVVLAKAPYFLKTIAGLPAP